MKHFLKNRTFSGLGGLFGGALGAGLIQLLVFSLAIPAAQAKFEATRIATGFLFPLYVCAPPGDKGRIFIAEQGGLIKIVDLKTNTVLPTPFLDISGIVPTGQGTGILGMTFDPSYATNGFFYVSYTTASGGVFGAGQSFISRFTVTDDPDIADPQSLTIVITADQTQHDHNFDWIGFSPRAGDEGNMYICSGDGGGSNDNGTGHLEPDGNAQSLQTLLGKILRIHIEPDGTYTIPPNNPFIGVPDALPEIFCYGLRNPFRGSFDSKTGDFFVGDVGEHNREEIDIIKGTDMTGGQNYGWRYREGFIQNPFYDDDPPPPNAVDPNFDYTHADTGHCVIGGYLYRGKAIRELRGNYIFGDFSGPTDEFEGHIFAFSYKNGVISGFSDLTAALFPTKVGGYDLGPLTSLGVDGKGEIYITDYNGNLFKIIPSTTN